MSNGLLEGKCGIVFGALNSDSIAWKAAEAIHAQGGKVVLVIRANYFYFILYGFFC